jgi:3-hydroxyisobutyrate dehydrogenase
MYKKIGFVGVGAMGKPMAANLLKAGFEVTICPHVNMAPVNALKELGVSVVPTPKEVASASEVVITCLPNTPDVEQVYFGPAGLMEGSKPGQVLIDTSTIDPIATQRFASLAAEKGCTFIDAPMSGGQAGAIAGTLTFMVGGDKDCVDSCKEIFDAMGTKLFYLGGPGAGEVVKLCNNLMLGINLVGVCEAFTMGAKMGVDSEKIAEVVQASSGGSAVIDRYFPKTILHNQYKPGFMLKLMCKDINLALDASRKLGIPSFAGTVSTQVLELVKSMGKGDDDFTVIATLYQEAAGTIIGKEDA